MPTIGFFSAAKGPDRIPRIITIDDQIHLQSQPAIRFRRRPSYRCNDIDESHPSQNNNKSNPRNSNSN